MNNLGAIVARIAALLGGAVAGAFLAEWIDRQLSSQTQVKSDYDRSRYAQGLAPRDAQSPSSDNRTRYEKPYNEQE